MTLVGFKSLKTEPYQADHLNCAHAHHWDRINCKLLLINCFSYEYSHFAMSHKFSRNCIIETNQILVILNLYISDMFALQTHNQHTACSCCLKPERVSSMVNRSNFSDIFYNQKTHTPYFIITSWKIDSEITDTENNKNEAPRQETS